MQRRRWIAAFALALFLLPVTTAFANVVESAEVEAAEECAYVTRFRIIFTNIIIELKENQGLGASLWLEDAEGKIHLFSNGSSEPTDCGSKFRGDYSPPGGSVIPDVTTDFEYNARTGAGIITVSAFPLPIPVVRAD